MRTEIRKFAAVVAAMAALLAIAADGGTGAQSPRRPIDAHTAFALTQIELYGTTVLYANADRKAGEADVLLLVSRENWARVKEHLRTKKIAVEFEDERSGYLRVRSAVGDIRTLFEWTAVDAARIDSLSHYQTRTQSQTLATQGFSPRGSGAPIVDRRQSVAPNVTVADVRAYPLNPDRDMGADTFRREHPTFDGRGVGIGILESTWIEADHKAFGMALGLDGSRRRKILRYASHGQSRHDGLAAKLSAWKTCVSALCEIDGRILLLPSSGRYRTARHVLLGAELRRPGTVTYTIVQRDEDKRLFVDTDTDDTLAEESALVDFNDPEWNARSIVSLTYPGAEPVRAVVSVDEAGFVSLHPFYDSHATHTSTAAAGSADEDNYAQGVAPNASLVFADVGSRSSQTTLSQTIEGAIALARGKDVDVISMSLAIQTPLGTSDSFDSQVFDRISEGYDKPVLISAGNVPAPVLGIASASGRVAMTVGQNATAATIESFSGLRPLQPATTRVQSAVGPAFDGSPRPDFLVPSARVVGRPCGQYSIAMETAVILPPCYSMSAGTSDAGPAAAGAFALLISAARQRGIDHSVHRLRDAIRESAVVVSTLDPHVQGTGVINVERAWQYLQRQHRRSTVTATGELRHPWTSLIGPVQPEGLIWIAESADPETLSITLRAGATASGPLAIASEGSLKLLMPEQVKLTTAPTLVPVRIDPPSEGRAGSSWISFTAADGTRVARVLATAARPFRLATPSYDATWEASPDVVNTDRALVSIPTGATGVTIKLRAISSSSMTQVYLPTGVVLSPNRFWSGPTIYPTDVAAPEEAVTTILDPGRGAWGFVQHERASSALVDWIGRGRPPAPARAEMTVTAYRTDCSVVDRRPSGTGETFRVGLRDMFAKPADGGAIALPARVESSSIALRDEFERKGIDIDVQPDAALLRVAARATKGGPVDLQLFNCTEGHCLPSTHSVPLDPSPTITLREPAAGRWKVFPVLSPSAHTASTIDVTVTQALRTDMAPLSPVASAGTTFDAEYQGVVSLDRKRGFNHIVVLRTDARAAAGPASSKEGFGAISVCVPERTDVRR